MPKEWDRLCIGLECEKRWRAEIKARLEAEVELRTQMLTREWARVGEIPTNQRPAWLRSWAGSEYLEDVEYALREVHGVPDDTDAPAPRGMRIEVRRPKGPAQKIMAAVADEWSKRLGRTVSHATVQRCWTAYRTFERELTTN